MARCPSHVKLAKNIENTITYSTIEVRLAGVIAFAGWPACSPLRRFGAMPAKISNSKARRNMAKPNLRDSTKPGPGLSLIESALRTLETEAGGITALAGAIRDGMGASFIAAAELIRAVKGRVIVTGMGKSGHVARKVAATLASTGTPAFSSIRARQATAISA